jgi:hypothetical protein
MDLYVKSFSFQIKSDYFSLSSFFGYFYKGVEVGLDVDGFGFFAVDHCWDKTKSSDGFDSVTSYDSILTIYSMGHGIIILGLKLGVEVVDNEFGDFDVFSCLSSHLANMFIYGDFGVHQERLR